MERDGHRHGTPGFRRVSIALFAGSFASFGLVYFPQPMLPEFSRSFDISAATSSLAISVATMTLGIGLLIAGPLSDAIGRTALMRWSLLLGSLSVAASAVVTDWTTMLVLRGVTGLLLAGFPAVAMAYLREEVHPRSHARAAGLYIAGTALGSMSGRLVAGGFTELAGWRWAIIGTAVYGLVSTALIMATLPSSVNFEPAARRIRSLARGFASALRDRVLVALYVIAGLCMGSYVAVFNITGFRLEGAPYLLPVGIAGLVYLLIPIGSVTSVIAGRMAERHGRGTVVPWGFVIAIGGVLLTLAAPLWLFISGLAVMVVGFFVVHAVASGWVPARAHDEGRSTGSAAALYLFGYYLGASVLGTLAGTVWRTGGWPLLVWCNIAVLAAGLVLALVVRRSGLRPTYQDSPADRP